MTSLVELIEVTKVLHNGGAPHTVLDGVTLSVESGEFAAVMGPSGSGKSTLLNLVAGLDRPTQGRIWVEGTELSTLSEAALARLRRRQIGIVFQFFNLLNNLTVLENVLVPAELAGIKASAARARARELLEQLGLAGHAKQYPARLSGGERQRVAIARALVNQPPLLLADEPTGALDSHNGERVIEQLTELNRGGQTILMVTHDAKLAAACAQRIVRLRDGRAIDDVRLSPSGQLSVPDVMRLLPSELTQ